MPATDRIVVYIEPELKAELEQVAQHEGRTLSGLLRYLAVERVRRAVEEESITAIRPPEPDD
jgi:molybdopterin-guanine dinucleotide biosynthesis protein A